MKSYIVLFLFLFGVLSISFGQQTIIVDSCSQVKSDTNSVLLQLDNKCYDAQIKVLNAKIDSLNAIVNQSINTYREEVINISWYEKVPGYGWLILVVALFVVCYVIHKHYNEKDSRLYYNIVVGTILLIFSICLIASYILAPISINDPNYQITSAGVTVNIMALVVAFAVGWQIYNSIDIKNKRYDIDNLSSKIKELEKNKDELKVRKQEYEQNSNLSKMLEAQMKLLFVSITREANGNNEVNSIIEALCKFFQTFYETNGKYDDFYLKHACDLLVATTESCSNKIELEKTKFSLISKVLKDKQLKKLNNQIESIKDKFQKI